MHKTPMVVLNPTIGVFFALDSVFYLRHPLILRQKEASFSLYISMSQVSPVTNVRRYLFPSLS